MKPIRHLALVVNADKPGAAELAAELAGVARRAGVHPATVSRGMLRLMRRSISLRNPSSSTHTNDTASPVAPARPVRPMRCT